MNPKSAPYLSTAVIESVKNEVVEISPALEVKKSKKVFGKLWCRWIK
jgi:hypothetical protein